MVLTTEFVLCLYCGYISDKLFRIVWDSTYFLLLKTMPRPPGHVHLI